MKQSHFATLLCDPDIAPPPDIAERPALRGLAVYRNNIHFGLISALGKRFSVTRRMMGDESFSFHARVFIVKSKPVSPLMMFFGDEFPDFIEALPELAEWPFLADVARIEAMRSHAYYAPDAPSLMHVSTTPETIEAWLNRSFPVHPALRILRSPYPAASLWANGGEAPDAWVAEDIAITRGREDVAVRIIPPGTIDALDALKSGATLHEAIMTATAGDVDPASLLVTLLHGDFLVHP